MLCSNAQRMACFWQDKRITFCTFLTRDSMLLYLARISAKKQYDLLDLFHRSNMQVEFFFICLVK